MRRNHYCQHATHAKTSPFSSSKTDCEETLSRSTGRGTRREYCKFPSPERSDRRQGYNVSRSRVSWLNHSAHFVSLSKSKLVAFSAPSWVNCIRATQIASTDSRQSRVVVAIPTWNHLPNHRAHHLLLPEVSSIHLCSDRLS